MDEKQKKTTDEYRSNYDNIFKKKPKLGPCQRHGEEIEDDSTGHRNESCTRQCVGCSNNGNTNK
jgi:hypothetical protein